MRTGFDNEKYLREQSQHIRERMAEFDGKLYLEFGGKLFDDHHASRVLPGFEPDSKIRMLKALSEADLLFLTTTTTAGASSLADSSIIMKGVEYDRPKRKPRKRKKAETGPKT